MRRLFSNKVAMPTPTAEEVAIWILIAWQRDQTLADAGACAGLVSPTGSIPFERCIELHALYPFLSPRVQHWRVPIRRYIASNWPKLSEWLWSGGHSREQLVRAAQKLSLMRCAKHLSSCLGGDDARELKRAARDDTANRVLAQARATQRHSASDWNVVKGPGRVRGGRMR